MKQQVRSFAGGLSIESLMAAVGMRTRSTTFTLRGFRVRVEIEVRLAA